MKKMSKKSSILTKKYNQSWSFIRTQSNKISEIKATENSRKNSSFKENNKTLVQKDTKIKGNLKVVIKLDLFKDGNKVKRNSNRSFL